MSIADVPTIAGNIRTFTFDDVMRMVDAGILTNEDRVELVDGVLVEMSPEGVGHVAVIAALTGLLVPHYPWPQFEVRVQSTMPLEERQYRIPDIVVGQGTGKARWFAPDDLILMVEVAQTSLRYDLDRKAKDYAGWGAPVYWVIDLQGKRVEVFAEPHSDGYASHRTVGIDGTLALPGTTSKLVVAEILSVTP
jgi:Uma2 family endonuclease